MTIDAELEQLLHDRFDISTTDFVAALKFLPASRPWAASLSEEQAGLLDAADFPEDGGAFVAAGIEMTGRAAHLAVTAFTAEQVSTGLGISASRVRQKRLANELWAIPDGQTWVFPVPQFETDEQGAPARQIRGLDQVFKALPPGLHPVAVAGFLQTPQPILVQGRPMTPVEWLRDGGDIDQVVAAAAATDWFTA